MHLGLKVAVVVPAYAESRLIVRTLSGLPAFVDHVVVVDDASPDDTVERAQSTGDPRVVVVERKVNGGVGQAILDGYRASIELGADVLVVMAADDQMDARDLPALLDPIARGHADYVKGNRFVHPRAKDMPTLRRVAGRGLAWLTSRLAGVRFGDSQCGYTALRAPVGRVVLAADVWRRYGYPNDLLILLGRRGFRIHEVPVRPVYQDETSGIRPWHVGSILYVILRRWWSERGHGSSALEAPQGSVGRAIHGPHADASSETPRVGLSAE